MRRRTSGVGPRGTVLVLGHRGGVGRAFVHLLACRPEGRALAARIDPLLLLDAEPAYGREVLPPRLTNARELPPDRITSAEHVAFWLERCEVDQVIDLAGVCTLDCIRVCEAFGVDLLTAGVQEWPGHPASLAELMAGLLDSARGAMPNTSCLIGAGMNPGVVNALALCAIDRLARRAGVERRALEQDVHALLVTENDTTRERDGDGDTSAFAVTWSPTHALEELLATQALVMRGGRIADAGHAPRAARYRARCKDAAVDGLIVPHEEVVTLGTRLPHAEVAFLYRLPPAARQALSAHPGRTQVEHWTTRKLYPPYTRALDGSDCVGVLLCTRSHGELWLGFDTDVETGLAHGTNATQLQVAVGVLAGWQQLGSVSGIHFVEDLDVRAYCTLVEAILGPAHEVYDPDARAQPLAGRRV